MTDKVTRVLLVEDNAGDARLVKEMLAEAKDSSFEVEWVDRLSGGLECLTKGGIDLVLLDLSLPDSHGFETFVKTRSQAGEVPIIVLSGLNDEAVAMEVVKEGAQDYLTKGRLLDGDFLAFSIRFAIERQQQMLKKLEQNKQELEARGARFGRVIANKAEGVIVADKDEVVRFINPAAEALLGRKTEEFLDKPFDFPFVAGETTVLHITHTGQTKLVEMRVSQAELDGETLYIATLAKQS